jgi:hypothetical protein
MSDKEVTLAAWDTVTRRTISFHDYVRDGEVVQVYRTMEAAEEERGAFTQRRVVRDGDEEWSLIPLDGSEDEAWEKRSVAR